MSARLSAHALACVLVLACCSAAGQEPPVGLSKNPFSRPDYMVVLQDAPASAVFAAEPVELHLIATLVSNGRPLANIDGEVLTTGDSYEGFRVLAIDEGVLRSVRQDGGADQDQEQGVAHHGALYPRRLDAETKGESTGSRKGQLVVLLQPYRISS